MKNPNEILTKIKDIDSTLAKMEKELDCSDAESRDIAADFQTIKEMSASLLELMQKVENEIKSN